MSKNNKKEDFSDIFNLPVLLFAVIGLVGGPVFYFSSEGEYVIFPIVMFLIGIISFLHLKMWSKKHLKSLENRFCPHCNEYVDEFDPEIEEVPIDHCPMCGGKLVYKPTANKI